MAPPHVLQQAIAAFRRGDIEPALALSGQAVATAAAGEFSAHTVHGEVLNRAGRVEDLQAFLQAHPEFGDDPRGGLLRARAARRSGDMAGAESALRKLLASGAATPFLRMGDFELVAVLSRLGRHDEAWETAEAAHRRNTRPFDTAALVEALRVTAKAPTAELAALPQASRRVERTAFILGLPRSGTTLLEQMLDAHPLIQGLGEGPLPGEMANAIAREGGGWPLGAQRVRRGTLDALQARYLRVSRAERGMAASVWSLEKTVFPMLQPLFIHGVLPGAKVLHLTRDARDNATSLFLSNFDPSWGWTGSLDSLRAVIAAERTHLPVILDKLKLDTLNLRLQDLVDEPEATLRRVLAHLDLDWHDACLHPQDNPRLVHTLSHEQVRRPVNSQGIGRWRVHAKRFGSEWDVL